MVSRWDWGVFDRMSDERTRVLAVVVVFAFIGAWSVSGQANEGGGGFEGTYAVGTTSCVVTPSKMSFEVVWKGRAKPEYFFYDESKSQGGSIVFSTDPDYNDGILETFIFVSPELDHGFFVGGDGKRPEVVRISGAPPY
jgi:hypothetical protein